jgi:PAS domain S-box-containing protein
MSVEKREAIKQLEEKIFRLREDGLDPKKKEKWFLSSEEVILLIEDLTLKNIQKVEIEHLNKEIGEMQNKYEELYDSYPGGCLTLNEEGKIKEASLIASHILGSEKTALQGQKFEQFVPPDSQEEFKTYYSSLLQSGTRQTQTLLLQNNSGANFKASLSGIAIIDSQKKSCHLRLVINEVKDSIKTETPFESLETEDDLRNYIRQRLYAALAQETAV